MFGDTPPCQGTRNRAFIDPGNSDRFKIAAAEKICEACPLIQECALAALTAGNLQDGTRAVANGVIQAGVICRGDQGTTDRLRAVAGLPNHPQAPRIRIMQKRAVITPGQPCKECSRPLWKFTRDRSEIPAGYVMAYARGWCEHCRSAYRQATAHTPKRQTREPIRKALTRCIQCDHPMVPRSHTLPSPDHRHHHSRGRCVPCSRPNPGRTPRTCVDCQIHLIGHGETPSGDDEAPVHGRGRCSPCYHRWRCGYEKRRELPPVCRGGCRRRLTTNRIDPLPQGWVLHHSRGWCDTCRNRERRRMKRERLTATQVPA